MMRILSSDVRPAEIVDAESIANIHWHAWQHVYAGIVPYRPLQELIARRNVVWWRKAIESETTLLLLEVHGRPVGYATVGLSRVQSLPQEGEVYEIYLLPEYQGLGFGRDLFNEARNLLTSLGCEGTICWTIETLEQASLFFSAMGGRQVARIDEHYGGTLISKISYVWD